MPEPVSATSAIDATALDARRDRQPAALRHRVLGVQEQVQEHLLQLVLEPEHHHRRRRCSSRRTLMRCGLELVLEQPSTSVITALRSTALRSDRRDAGPRQVQQAVDDLRGAERLPLDLLEQPRARVLGIGALEQHLREARDAGQRRVHLVRDACRQQADRRHLLRDLQLLFELRRAP